MSARGPHGVRARVISGMEGSRRILGPRSLRRAACAAACYFAWLGRAYAQPVEPATAPPDAAPPAPRAPSPAASLLAPAAPSPSAAPQANPSGDASLRQELDALRAEVAGLRAKVDAPPPPARPPPPAPV